MQRLKLNKYFLPAHIFAFLMFVAASLSMGELEKLKKQKSLLAILFSDFGLHSGVFGVFTGLLCYGFYKVRGSSIPFFKVGVIAFGFGVFIEIYQAILPHRSFALDDIAFDLVGIVIVLIISKLIT